MLQICAPDSIIKINAGDGRSSVFPSPAFLHRRVLTDAGLIHTWKHNMVGWLLAFYMYPFSNICTISEWGLPPHIDAWHQHVLESCLWFMFIFCSYARHFSFMVPGTKARPRLFYTDASLLMRDLSTHRNTTWLADSSVFICILLVIFAPSPNEDWPRTLMLDTNIS